MNKSKKTRFGRALSATVLMVVICAVSIGGTVAWLTASTEPVVNVFSTGNITITLDEAKLGEEGRTSEGNTGYKIYPGAVIAKDPTVTVKATSEPCYVFAYVENGLLLQDASVAAFNIDSAKWIQVGETDNKAVYRFYQVVDAAAADKVLDAVFTTVTIDTAAVTEANIASLQDKTVTIQAYAHQSNATTQAVATAAALAKFSVEALDNP